MPILQIDHLTKRYGSLHALDNLDLTIEAGQVFGLLGPNGSGKTTLLAIVLDVIHSNAGSFQWFDGKYGTNPRRHIGALLETPNFYPYLNADQNLNLIAEIKQVKNPPLDALLDLVQLKERRHSPFKSYSLGMKQRLALAACLIGDPDVLILDEPTNGLDPEGMIEVRHIIQKIAAQGKTIILASHMLDEVEKICSHVAIIKKGKRLATGEVGSILNKQPTLEISCAENDTEKLRLLLENNLLVSNLRLNKGRFTLELREGHQPGELNQLAFENGILLHHLVSKPRSLEMEFLEITRS
ncbi:MAG: ATP-binding cassette domain-containing protein [Chthoniobacterales bacterium]